ncbi:hypothetical protein Tco_0911904 [Tanacetum coccineum]
MFVDLQYVQYLEKEIGKLESDKADFSNIYDLLLQECVSKDVMCFYLHSLSDLDAHTELQCMSFAKLEQHSISLEIALQQCQEQMKNETVCKQNRSTIFLKECEQYHEIQDLKAQLHDKNIAISELKKLIKKMKGKTMDTKFDKPSVVRQPNALKIPKPSVLGKPTPFSDSLERKKRQAVRNTNVIKPGMYRIDTRTTQTRAPRLLQTFRNTNPHVSTSTRVIHKPTVSRPQLKSNQMKDKAVQNNSQVKFKKTEVEDHHRISSVSSKRKLIRYFSFGGHLDELHVTWAHLEKKQTRLRTYTNIAQEFLLRGWRRRHRYNVTPSQRYPRRHHKIPQRRQSTRPSPLSRIFSFMTASRLKRDAVTSFFQYIQT